MKESKIFIVFPPPGKSLKQIQKSIQMFKGFYNGVGYVFPESSKEWLDQLSLSIPFLKIIPFPISEDQTFESIKQMHKVDFFKDKLFESKKNLNLILNNLSLSPSENLSESFIDSLSIQETDKINLSNAWIEYSQLTKEVEWAEGIAKTLAMQPNQQTITIQFLKERKINFLLDDAPEMPRLINFLDHQGIIRPFIRKGITGMVVGAGGVGKTHWLTQLALSIASGNPFLNTYPIEEPGHVFLGLGENSEEDIHRIIRKTFKGLFHLSAQLSLEELEKIESIANKIAPFSFTGMRSAFISQGHPTPIYESFLAALKKKEPAEGWACIILDPISRFLGSDAETDNAAATAFIELLEKIIMELKGKPTILFGHHMNKSGVSGTNTDQAAARGSSAITDGIRWQVNLEKITKTSESTIPKFDKPLIRMRVVKSNFTGIPKEQILKKETNGILSVLEEIKLKSIFG